MFKHQKFSGLIFISFLLTLASCKKEANDVMVNSPANPFPASPLAPTTPRIIQFNQVAFKNTQDYYLWNTQLPTTLNFSSYADPVAVITRIRQYSVEPGFSSPVDRWSFAIKKTDWDKYSGGMSSLFSATSAAVGDFGIKVFFHSEGDLRVRLTEPNSAGGKAGIRRGWRIIKINGNKNITTSNTRFITENIYNSTSSVIGFLKPDGTATDITLHAGQYVKKPVYMDTVYKEVTGKVGYMVYNSFLGNRDQSTAEYARVFSKFASAGVKDLIVDLRYNGGGYVALQENMANYIINSAASGGIMMKQIYNSKHTAENATSYFNKAGSLNLSRVYFIVGRGTASASELLINNLKPYMDVRLIGAANTHGKPVGYFPIENGEWYVFPVSFKSVNRNGEGDFYSGFAPNVLVADGLDKDWGDVSEASLASTLNIISSGNFRDGSGPAYNEPYNVTKGNAELDENMLKITIGRR